MQKIVGAQAENAMQKPAKQSYSHFLTYRN